MFRTLSKLIFIALFSGFIAACSGTQFYHEYVMSGTVVAIEGERVVVCIGSEDGAKPGMILDVFAIEYTGTIMEGTDNYSQKVVGEIRIDSIIDEHFARGSIVKGHIEPNNVAELRSE
jgi:hypothetical protein